MPPMPFYLEKGPAFSIIEDYLNGDDRRALNTLETIRIPKDKPGFTELWDLPVFDPDTLPRPPGMPTYRDDFREKWCGYQFRNGAWVEPDLEADDNVGVWMSYAGRVEAITRQTLRTALEVSLGIDRDEGVPRTGAAALAPRPVLEMRAELVRGMDHVASSRQATGHAVM